LWGNVIRIILHPDGYIATDTGLVEFIQFSDDGWSSHQVAGSFTFVTHTGDGMETNSFAITGTRNDNQLSMTAYGGLGFSVGFSGEFDLLQRTPTIHVTNTNSGCVDSGTLVAASIQEYNDAVNAVRAGPTRTTGPQSETCA
jgi:hypothetical protein